MGQYRLVPEAQYRELVAMAERFSSVVAALAGAPRMEMNLPSEPRPPETEAIPRPETPTPTHVRSAGKYRVSRKRGDWSWADVAAQVMNETVFSLDEAADTMLPLIETDATRPRDSLRVALDRDPRFTRQDRGGEVWYRRVDPSQLDIDSEPHAGAEQGP